MHKLLAGYHHLLRALLVAAALAGALEANACTIPPDSAFAPVRALVDRTKRIVLGDVQSVRVEGWYSYYRIKVVEQLKGQGPLMIDLRFGIPYRDAAKFVPRRFVAPRPPSTHEGAAFWVGETAAGGINSMCGRLRAAARNAHYLPRRTAARAGL